MARPYKRGMDPLHILFRWLHVVAIIVLVGGAFFMRVVLHPSTRALPDDAARSLRADVIRRWFMVLRACMVVILASGFFNYLVVMRPRHAGQSIYDALIGTKILLALAIFGIAEALVKKDPPRWLTVNLLLAALLIGISSYAKFLPTN